MTNPIRPSSRLLHLPLWLLTATGALNACGPAPEAPPDPQAPQTLTAEFDTPFGRKRLPYVEEDGYAVMGDIILGRLEDIGKQPRSTIVNNGNWQWPLGVVQFEVQLRDSSGGEPAFVMDAIRHWESNTNLRFARNATHPDRVIIKANSNPTFARADMGRSPDGRPQEILIGTSAFNVGVMIHEIGHAIGLAHEHSRPGRDTFVDVFPTCIQSGQESNFAIFGNTRTPQCDVDGGCRNVGSYDIQSVMHYDSLAFVNTSARLPNGTPCTRTIQQKGGRAIPINSVLSFSDIRNLREVTYGRMSATKVGSPGASFVVDGAGDVAGLSPDQGQVFRRVGTTWTPSGSPLGQRVASLVAGGNRLFAIHDGSKDIYRFDGGTTWTKIGGPGRQFVVDGNGTLSAIGADGAQIFRYSGTGTNWGAIGSPGGRPPRAVYAGGSALFAEHENGDIHRFDGGTTWTRIGSPGAQFVVLSDGALFGLTPNRDSIFRFNSGTNWSKVGGAALLLYGGGSNRLFAYNHVSGELWTLDGDSSWHLANRGAGLIAGGTRFYSVEGESGDLYEWR